jgi:hypothetical protein
MQGHELLHNLFQKSSLSIHKKRIAALTNASGALLVGKQLTLTGLGRSSLGEAKERHAIRGMDRLLGNKHLQKEQSEVYKTLMGYLLTGEKAWILIDWSPLNNRRKSYLLRASIALKGRSYTIYQEVHSKQNSPGIEKLFLETLATLLPKKIKTIIIADAGFRATWFKEVRALGFDFVGRIRNVNKYQIKGEETWDFTSSLYEKANNKPQGIPSVLLAKSNPVECNFVLVKKDMKGRKHKNSTGTLSKNTETKRSAKAAREPWLLATSLPIASIQEINKIVYFYEKRMQIEEEFRDTKSPRYGHGLRYSLTNDAKRIEILLLIGTLTCFACWLIALSAQRKGLQYDYQSNSIKTRTVLSITYLATQVTRKEVYFTKQELLTSLTEMRELANLEGGL